MNDPRSHPQTAPTPDAATPAAHAHRVPVRPRPPTHDDYPAPAGASCPTCHAAGDEPCHYLEIRRHKIVHRRDMPVPPHAGRFHTAGLRCAPGCPACPAPPSGADPDDGGSAPDNDGISVRLDGDEYQFVILGDKGHVTVGGISDLSPAVTGTRRR